MKKLLIFTILLAAIHVSAASMSDAQANKIADAIFKVENSHSYPYGIKSINTHGNPAIAREICITTVKNNFIRWQKSGSPGDYLDFLADRYCPPSVDKIGNRNWKINIHKLL